MTCWILSHVPDICELLDPEHGVPLLGDCGLYPGGWQDLVVGNNVHVQVMVNNVDESQLPEQIPVLHSFATLEEICTLPVL